MEPLVDGWAREIKSVRVSVTDKCNFRCRYCMPAEGLDWLPRDEVLSFEEIERIVRVLAAMGLDEVRLTGGEPLVRRELPELVRMLAAVPGVDDLSLTTNGVLLDRLAEPLAAAGLDRVTVSCDSLLRHRFAEMTRRDALEKVLRGIDAAAAAGLTPIKINCVLIAGQNEGELVRFAEFARETGHEVRFIEYMPLDAERVGSMDKVLPNDEVRRIVETVHPLVPDGREVHGTSSRWHFADGAGSLGFISPVTHPFCADCDRIRLTADGQLRTCLFSRREWDLKAPLRAGASDEELERHIRFAVRHKELKHRINEPGFVRASRSMSQIGG